MATQTTNYGLTMPSYNEVADIEVINDNMNLIDAQMKKNADGVSKAKGIVSDEYSVSSIYNIGDYCIYENKLYRCITAVTTGEAFDSAKWKETSVKSELSTLNSNISNKILLRQEILQFDANGYADVPQVEGYRIINVVGADDNWHIELYTHSNRAIARRSIDYNTLIKDGTLTVGIYYVS